MKKSFLLVLGLAIIILILLGVLVWWPTQKTQQTTKQQEQAKPIMVEGINIISPKIGEQITSPLKITGTTNGGGWSGFEGQVGTVQVLDYKGNKIGQGILKTTTDWTKPQTNFESTITLDGKYKGPATLFFSNENPSGDKSKEKHLGLSVVIK